MATEASSSPEWQPGLAVPHKHAIHPAVVCALIGGQTSLKRQSNKGYKTRCDSGVSCVCLGWLCGVCCGMSRAETAGRLPCCGHCTYGSYCSQGAPMPGPCSHADGWCVRRGDAHAGLCPSEKRTRDGWILVGLEAVQLHYCRIATRQLSIQKALCSTQTAHCHFYE